MKKIFALILCLMLLCATPLVAFADGSENLPTENETVTEGENSPPTEETEGPNWGEVKDTISGAIVNWIIPHAEEISVVVTLILTAFYNMRKHKLLNKSMGTLNNNAITVAKESSNFMAQALSNIESASGAVTGYDTRILALLEEFKTTAEDRAMLEKELVELKNYLHTATKANVELANEIASLITLANIPVYKKEELGGRHLAAVNAIIEAEEKAEAEAAAAAALLLPATSEEVKGDVGEEKKN